MLSKLNKWCLRSFAMEPINIRTLVFPLLGVVVLMSGCSTVGSPVSPGSPLPSASAPVSSSPSIPPSALPPTPVVGQPNESEPAEPSPSETVIAGGPEDVPPDDTDYSQDVGNTPQQYEYEPELEPPDSVVATLCNMNQVFFKGLRKMESGATVADSNLRTSLVGLDDLTDYWKTLRPQYPEAATDIDIAIAIREQWATALLDQDNGDPSGAKEAMAAAEELIKKLPEVDAVSCKR